MLTIDFKSHPLIERWLSGTNCFSFHVLRKVLFENDEWVVLKHYGHEIYSAKGGEPSMCPEFADLYRKADLVEHPGVPNLSLTAGRGATTRWEGRVFNSQILAECQELGIHFEDHQGKEAAELARRLASLMPSETEGINVWAEAGKRYLGNMAESFADQLELLATADDLSLIRNARDADRASEAFAKLLGGTVKNSQQAFVEFVRQRTPEMKADLLEAAAQVRRAEGMDALEQAFRKISAELLPKIDIRCL